MRLILLIRKSLRKAIAVTEGAFVISEEAIASSPPEVAYLFKRKTIDSIQNS